MSAERLVGLLKEKGLTAATAESCTGGMIAEWITSVPGASCVFHCGIVAYSNEIKERILGVKPETIARFSAVSGETAAEMAAGGFGRGHRRFGHRKRRPGTERRKAGRRSLDRGGRRVGKRMRLLPFYRFPKRDPQGSGGKSA